MVKRGLIIFSLVFLSIFLLSVNFVNAEVSSCRITTRTQCQGTEVPVLGLSAQTNSHGQLGSQTGYNNYVLCCEAVGKVGSTQCTGNNKILGLSAVTNAHAQLPTQSTYNEHVCFDEISCTTTTASSCPPTYPISTVSLSSTSNAHIAQFSYYPYKVCCRGDTSSGPQCGDSIIESPEKCDDGNSLSYDGCSYTNDGNDANDCQVETGYECFQPIVNGPSCCYSFSPVSAWTLERAGQISSFSGGSIQENDILRTIIFEDYCLPPGTERTISIYRDRTIGSDVLIKQITAITNSGVSGGGFSGSWLVSQADLQALGEGTSKILFKMDEPSTGEGVQSSVISVSVTAVCTPAADTACNSPSGDVYSYDSCGNPEGIVQDCTSEQTCKNAQCVDVAPVDLCEGVSCPSGQTCDANTGDCIAVQETCSSLGYECGTVGGESCGTCNTQTQQCTSGQCVAIPQCSITSASWGTPLQVVEGTSVNLNVQTANCNGKLISFVIKEKDSGLNPDDDVVSNPPSQTVSGSSITAVWNAEYQDDTDGGQSDPPEYYFTASVDGKSLKSSNELEVLENNYCSLNEIDYCNDYDQAHCGTDSCNVGSKSVGGSVSCGLNYNEDTRCTDIISCGCSWNTQEEVCVASFDEVTQCGTCGNGVPDFGEECDDGNFVSGDGCSYPSCELEVLPVGEDCPVGTTLCSDNTCSIDCRITDTDYSDNGCTSSDLDGLKDSCVDGALCYIEDSYCCKVESDGVCNPYCAFSDQDCGVSDCGNGYREFGEECDLGILNGADSGCLSGTCTYDSNLTSVGGCPEGTSLCSDNTCSLNCFATDDGYASLSLQASSCATGLTYSGIDNACCRATSNGVCNPYCASFDNDCSQEELITGGSCDFVDNSKDDCEDGILERNITAIWVGESQRSASCKNIVDRLVCPAQIKVDFFGTLQFVISVILIVLIYFIIKSRLKEKQRERSVKKVVRKKGSRTKSLDSSSKNRERKSSKKRK